MPKKPLTRNELLDYLAEVQGTQEVYELAEDEFILKDLMAKGMTENPARRFIFRLQKEGKVQGRKVRYKGHMAVVYKWVGGRPG